MDAIAAEAGVTKQTVYRYYASKHQLFSAVLGEMADRLQADILELTPTTPLTTHQLEAILASAAGRILDHTLDPTYLDTLRVVISESRQFPALSDRLWTSFIQRGAAAISRLLQSTGLAAGADVASVAAAHRLFVGPLLTYVMEALLGDPHAVRQRATEQVAVLVHLFLLAVRSAGPGTGRASS